MTVHVFVYRIRDVQQEDHRPQRHETAPHEDMGVVAVPPSQHRGDAPWVEEHEEGGNGPNHADDILDTGGEGGEEGSEEEP